MLSYAGLLVPVALVDGAGNAQGRQVVDVLNVDGTTATVYADAARTALTGAVASDATGNVSGVYAEPGVYRLRFSVLGVSYEVQTVASIDPREITDLHTLVTGNSGSVSAEATARTAADSAESSARAAADSAEAALRASGDTNETNTRAAADAAEAALRASLAATEAADAAAAATANGNEVTARAAAVLAEQNRALAAEAANAASIASNTSAVARLTLTTTATKTAAYTAAPGDLIPVSTAGGPVTVTLPAAPATGTLVAVKHTVQGGTNTVTIAASGTDHFNTSTGPTTATLTLLNQAVHLQYAGGVWLVVADDLPLSQLDGRFLTPSAAAGAYVTVVEHGATAGTARPAGATRVFWRGTVQPTNAVQYDRWVNTSASPYTESIYDGSTWTALGFGTGASLSTAQNWTARQRFTVMPQIFGASGDSVPILARSVGDGLANGAINIVHDGTTADILHMVTGPNTGPSRTVTDGVLNGTTTITSATANFTTGPVTAGVGTDIGKTVTGTGIPAGTVIASVTNATTAVLSQAATATASGVTLALGSGPNNNGCVIAIGVDNGGTGIISRNKSTGIALHVDQLDSVSASGAYACFMYHESHVAPFSRWVMTSTATKPMFQLAPNVSGSIAAGAKWFEVFDVDLTYAAGYINADDGKIDWRRSISATAPAASFTPLVAVNDEVATYPTTAYLKAKTTADAGLYILRNNTGSSANPNIFGGRIVMDTANSDRLSIEAVAGSMDRTGALTWRKLLWFKGGVGTTGGLGFFAAAPVGQQATQGTTTGFNGGTGTTVVSGSSFTGGTGTGAYTIGDIVLALKNYGLLAA